MAYRYGDRHQMNLMPQSVEEYVSKDNPVRVYDAFVEGLDFRKLGIDINPGKVGNYQYDPLSMLKLLIKEKRWCSSRNITFSDMF